MFERLLIKAFIATNSCGSRWQRHIVDWICKIFHVVQNGSIFGNNGVVIYKTELRKQFHVAWKILALELYSGNIY